MGCQIAIVIVMVTIRCPRKPHLAKNGASEVLAELAAKNDIASETCDEKRLSRYQQWNPV